MVRKSVTYNYASYGKFWFLTNMTSSVIYYGIYAQQHGIYLLNNTKRKLLSYKFISIKYYGGIKNMELD